MEEKIREYTNGEITVVWKAHLCTHVCLCFTQLRKVFNPAARPWIDMSGATSERIIEQVERCPSGALSYYRNAEQESKDQD